MPYLKTLVSWLCEIMAPHQFLNNEGEQIAVHDGRWVAAMK